MKKSPLPTLPPSQSSTIDPTVLRRVLKAALGQVAGGWKLGLTGTNDNNQHG